MAKARVLSVDDDNNLQVVVGHYLENEGYDVITAESGESLKKVLQTETPNIILLDLVLPDTDGLTLIGHIKTLPHKIPVIVVSGKSDTTEKIVCLEMGADDYITKPFEMRELSARIKAVLRRSEETANGNGAPTQEQSIDRVSFGPWVLDRSRLQIFDNKEQSADLTTGEFKLLDALVRAHNRVLSREKLFELTRENEYDSYDRAVDIQIGRLRKKLGDDPKSPQFIKTVRGAGYMFTAPVDSSAA